MAGDDLIVEAKTQWTLHAERKAQQHKILYSDSAGFIDTVLRVSFWHGAISRRYTRKKIKEEKNILSIIEKKIHSKHLM